MLSCERGLQCASVYVCGLCYAAIRQAIAKALVAFYQKFVDEQSKKEIKDLLVQYDRTLLVADPRRCEPKKCACCCTSALYCLLSVHHGSC